jgi:uncharacterized membrane protein YqjE
MNRAASRRAGGDGDGSTPGPPDAVAANLRRLLDLEIELALAEARAFILRATLTAGICLGAIAALFAALALLLAAALATAFPIPWQHLAAAGAVVLLAAGAAIVWSLRSLRRLRLPREAVASIQETGHWLAGELGSRVRVLSRVGPRPRRHGIPGQGEQADASRPS